MKLDHEDLNRLIEKISTSDIQEFSLEGEDFKLEIKRNLFDQSQVTNNLVSNNSFDRGAFGAWGTWSICGPMGIWDAQVVHPPRQNFS